MPSTFTIVTRASADPAALFNASLDIDAHVASMAASGERAIGGVTTGSIGLGESVTWRARHFGIWFTMTSEITALERPERFVDEQTSGPFRVFRHEHTFGRAGDTTVMTDTLTVGSPVFGALAERLVLVPYLRRLIRQRNAHLLARLHALPGTSPEAAVWLRDPADTRERFEQTARIGTGDGTWERASRDLLRWEIKTRSGFRVDDARTVVAGRTLTVTATVAGVTVREPVQVVTVVETPTRVGFSYRTLPGHPVTGEEAFILHREGDAVFLTIRSLTAPATTQPWRVLFPALRLAQRVARRRYMRALRE